MKRKTDPLLDAVLRNDAAALELALQQGSGVDQPDREGRTPLANAIISERLAIAEMLLRAGANANAADKQGLTPLHFAAQRYSLALVNLLLGARAEVDPVDSYGNTPLFRAIFESRGRADVVKALLGAGANQHLKNTSGVSPRDLAETIANFDVLSLLPKHEE